MSRILKIKKYNFKSFKNKVDLIQLEFLDREYMIYVDLASTKRTKDWGSCKCRSASDDALSVCTAELYSCESSQQSKIKDNRTCAICGTPEPTHDSSSICGNVPATVDHERSGQIDEMIEYNTFFRKRIASKQMKYQSWLIVLALLRILFLSSYERDQSYIKAMFYRFSFTLNSKWTMSPGEFIISFNQMNTDYIMFLLSLFFESG